MFPHTNDPSILFDLNQSYSIPRKSFERAVVGNRFPRLSSSFDAVAHSRNRHDPTNSQSTSMPLRQRNIPSMELSQGDGGNPRANQHRETFHGMRNAVIDPRKSRRHGTDFGLGRHVERSLNSDCQDPSRATVVTIQDNVATDGDSVSSLFECIGLDFPQPPPIGSPVIRRMRSSPWFAEKECMGGVILNQESRRPRRSASVLMDSDFRGPCDTVRDETTNDERGLHLSPYFDLGINDIGLEMVGEALVGLDMNASNLGPQKLFLDSHVLSVPSCGFSQASDSGRQVAKFFDMDGSTPSDLLRWSTSHRSPLIMLASMSQQPVPSEDALHNDCVYKFRTKSKPVLSLGSEHQNGRSIGRLPRIIRKVASMRSDTRADTRADDTKCIPLGSREPRTISRSRSFRSIALAACEASNNAHSTTTTVDGNPHNRGGWKFANLDYLPSSKDAQDLQCTFSATSSRVFEHGKDGGTQHMSLPSSGLGSLGPKATQYKGRVTALHHMALSGPFLHRETRNKSLAKTENDLPNGTDKSFIDITPKQETKHEHSAAATRRARVKKLITRASSGIMGWGKQLRRKNSSVK